MNNHHQQPQQQGQETMVLLDSKENPNLEITHNHYHSSNITLAAKERHTMPPTSPPLPPPPLQHFKKTHHYNHIHVSKKINKNEGFTIKNTNLEVINRLTSISSNSSLAAREGNKTAPPPPPPPPPPSLSQEYFMKTNHQNHAHVSNKMNKNEGFTIKNTNLEVTKKLNTLSCSNNSSLTASAPEAAPPPEVALEESGRDRLKRHRAEMAGRVRIPDIWGHEDLLKEWIDCTVFDSSLGKNSIMSAQAALVQERRSNLRIENQC